MTARSDGSIECSFCTAAFTVQVQPQFPAFPMSVGGEPYPWPGRPDSGGMPMPGGDGGMANPGEEPFADENGENPFAEQGEEGEEDEEGEPEEDEDEEEAEVGGSKGPPPFTKKKSYRTVAGDELGEADFLRHLAIMSSTDPARTAAKIKASRR